MLSSLDSFRWCLRPGCKSGQIHETGTNGPLFRCHACGFRVCVIHNVPWHKGETCTEFDYRTMPGLKKAEEIASAKTIRKTTKTCPQRSCRAPIEKNRGCDHMTCKRFLHNGKSGCSFRTGIKCGHEFCWHCLAPYKAIRKKGNSAHNITCSYYTP